MVKPMAVSGVWRADATHLHCLPRGLVLNLPVNSVEVPMVDMGKQQPQGSGDVHRWPPAQAPQEYHDKHSLNPQLICMYVSNKLVVLIELTSDSKIYKKYILFEVFSESDEFHCTFTGQAGPC
jgi:hypothetical protein